MIIQIGDRRVGDGQPCFIVAEAGVNHNGRLDLAHKLIDAAKNASVDAVKFQTFRADALVSPGAPKASYQTNVTNPHESQVDMLRGLQLSEADHRELMAH